MNDFHVLEVATATRPRTVAGSSPKFALEIKSANFRRIAEEVLCDARKELAALDQRVMIVQYNRVGVEERRRG